MKYEKKKYEKLFMEYSDDNRIARYNAIKNYTERRFEEIMDNAAKFVLQIRLMLYK